MAEKTSKTENTKRTESTEIKAKGAKKSAAKAKESVKSEVKSVESADKQVASKLDKLIKEIGNLSVIELSDLVKALQEKFGVTAAAPAVATPAGPAPAGEAPAAEQTTFNVILAEAGPNRISVIKAVKELVPDLGLKEAKDLVESAPKQILTGVNKEKAEEAKKKLEEAGAKVELK